MLGRFEVAASCHTCVKTKWMAHGRRSDTEATRERWGGGCQRRFTVVGQSSLWGKRRKKKEQQRARVCGGDRRWTPREVVVSHHQPGSRRAGWIRLSWESSATVAEQWLSMGLTWTAPHQTPPTPSWTARRGLPQLWGASSSSLRSLTSWATSWSSSPCIGTKNSGTQVSPGGKRARAWPLSWKRQENSVELTAICKSDSQSSWKYKLVNYSSCFVDQALCYVCVTETCRFFNGCSFILNRTCELIIRNPSQHEDARLTVD